MFFHGHGNINTPHVVIWGMTSVMKTKEKEGTLKSKPFLNVATVFRVTPEKLEEVLEELSKSVPEIIYIKHSYGKLYIKEEISDLHGEEERK